MPGQSAVISGIEQKVKKEQRVISLGFKKPKQLEGDIIYVNFTIREDDVAAEAVSNEEFEFNTIVIAGNPLHGKGKSTSTERGTKYGNSYVIPYQGFINDLIQCNNGSVDYFRLILEGSRAHLKLEQITALIKRDK